MKKILFLSNHFITLYAFRKELILELISRGYDVYLSLPDSEENAYFTELGCKVILTKIDRQGACIGDNCMIFPGAYIDRDVIIGDNCYIGSGVKLIGKIRIGNNCIIREYSW